MKKAPMKPVASSYNWSDSTESKAAKLVKSYMIADKVALRSAAFRIVAKSA